MSSCPSCRRRFIASQAVCPLDGSTLVPSQGELPTTVGRQLGAYQLVCLLGEGGMGNIYVGHHTTLGRYVAIKMLRPELATRKDNVVRFFQEAKTINSLKHPNIVESLDLVEDVTDGAYCVLELLKGPDLKARLAREPLQIESAIRIATQLADALGKVHAVGVVHRDLKPENLILIQRDGRDDFVKLIDFGIAQIGERDGAIVGTAAYMAPEQAAKGATIDRRADIYALGVILFEMVTGKHPFPSATDSEYLIHHADTKPPRPSKLNSRCSAALELVILKCLEKAPADRYASADQVAAALRMIDARAHSGGRAGWMAASGVLVVGAAAAAFLVVPNLIRTQSPAVAASEPSTLPIEAPRAPTPAPRAPAAEPATPKLVELRIVSTPEGATVYRSGETIALGVTPFEVPLPRSEKPVEMRFEKSGYQSKTVEVPLEADLAIDVALSKTREPIAAKTTLKPAKPKAREDEGAVSDQPKATTSSKVHREGVIDPFAKP